MIYKATGIAAVTGQKVEGVFNSDTGITTFPEPVIVSGVVIETPNVRANVMERDGFIVQAIAEMVVFPIRLGYRLGIISKEQRQAYADWLSRKAAQLAQWRQERGE